MGRIRTEKRISKGRSTTKRWTWGRASAPNRVLKREEIDG